MLPAHDKTWPSIPFLIINLSLPIKSMKTMSSSLIQHPEQADPNRMWPKRNQNINRLYTLIEISQQRIRRNCKELGGHLIDFCRWLQRLIKLESWCRATNRAHKAWVEAGLGPREADNELHRLCGIYSTEEGSCYRALLFAIKNWLWQTYDFQ